MADYYCDWNNGNNSNPGTELLPKQTMNAGTGLLSGGDTLHVKTGTYVEAMLNNIQGGSAGNLTTIKAFTGHNPVIQPSSGYRCVFLSGSARDYIEWDGIDCNGTNLNTGGGNCVKLDESGGTTARFQVWKNTTFYNSPASGFLAVSNGSSDGGSHTITNCSFHDDGLLEKDHGFYNQQPNSTIELCDFHTNAGSGVQNTQQNGSNPSGCIYRYCQAWNNGQVNKGFGLLIYSNNGLIYNSISRDNQLDGIQLWNSPNNAGIYNNTIVDNGSVSIKADGGASNTTIQNNICWSNGTDPISVGGSGNTISNNLISNPSFVNKAGKDYHIQLGSSAIGGAADQSAIFTDDFDRVTRSSWDIGAYEFVAVDVFYCDWNFGDNSNPGTELLPKKTMNAGIALVGSGETLQVKNGTYVEDMLNNIPGGVISNLTLIKAFTGHNPVLQPSSGFRAIQITGDGGGGSDYIEWDGIDVDGINLDSVSGNCAKFDGTTHFSIGHVWKNAAFYNAPRAGFLLTSGGTATEEGGSHTFTNCVFRNNGTEKNNQGVYNQQPSNTFELCDFHTNAGPGTSNISQNSSNPHNSTYRYSQFYNNGQAGAQPGIVLHGNNHLVYNNIFRDNANYGIQTWNGGTNVGIYNNTIVDNGSTSIITDGGPATLTNSTIQNNICWSNGLDSPSISGVGNTVSANLTTDPDFVDEIGNDFHLGATSTAINAAVDQSAIFTDDFDGTTRVAWDIGAYEFTGVPVGTFYLDPSGDDAGAGTELDPWATFDHAAATVGAGSTVIIKGGLYTIPWFTGPASNTTWRVPTGQVATLQAIVGSNHCIRLIGAADGVVIESEDQDGFIIDGTNVNTYCFRTTQSSGVSPTNGTLRKVAIVNGQNHNVFLHNTSSGWTLEDCHVYNNQKGDSTGHCVHTEADNTTIVRGTYHGTFGVGINAEDVGGTTPSTVIVYGATVYDFGGAAGIRIGATGLLGSCQVYNNIVYGSKSVGVGSRHGISFMGSVKAVGQEGSVYSNTIYNVDGNGIQIENCSDARVRNNAIHTATVGIALIGGASPAIDAIVEDNRTFACATDIDDQGTNSTITSNDVGDPLFSDTVVADFTLLNASPCIDAGQTLGAPWNVDFDGTARPLLTGYDQGAYEAESAQAQIPITSSDSFSVVCSEADGDVLDRTFVEWFDTIPIGLTEASTKVEDLVAIKEASESFTVGMVDVAAQTNDWTLALSGNFAPAATTVQLLAPDTKTTGDFVAGRIEETDNPTADIDITNDNYTEVEFCLTPTGSATVGTYAFRIVLDDGSVFDTYTVTPEADALLVGLAEIASSESLGVGMVDAVAQPDLFSMASSDDFAAGATTFQLSAPATKTTGDFVAGRIEETDNPTADIDITSNDYTEIEFCFQSVSDIETETYAFRVVLADGSVLDTYTVTPEVAITELQPKTGTESLPIGIVEVAEAVATVFVTATDSFAVGVIEASTLPDTDFDVSDTIGVGLLEGVQQVVVVAASENLPLGLGELEFTPGDDLTIILQGTLVVDNNATGGLLV
jgi:hypothetical protein